MRIKSSICGLLALVIACGSDGNPAEPPAVPAATDAGSDGPAAPESDAGGDGATGEPPWIPAPALANLNFDGAVLAAVHAGNGWFVGGDFTLADMIAANRLVAVDMAGQPTGCSVQAGFDDRVQRITHIGNALYAVGPFRTYRGQPANYIAKIDATTCQLDAAFSPPANNGFDADVRTIATNGTSLYVGGVFTSYRGQSANRIAKLDPITGALDATFSPPASNGFEQPVVTLVATASDVYVGGAFTSYRGVQNNANFIARLNAATGALVSTFGTTGATSNGFNTQVNALALSGNTLYAAGSFTQYKGVANSANRIAKIDVTTGSIDTVFSPVGASANGFSNDASALELAPDGLSLFVGGAFDNYRGVTGNAHRIAKLNATTGVLDTTFSPLANNGFAGNILSITAVGTSIIVGGGPLGGYRGSADLFGVAKIDATSGVLDTSFMRPTGHDRTGFGVGTGLLATHVVGTTIWIGGNFTQFGGKSANGIARFSDATGAFDTSFSPSAANGFNAEVYSLAASGNALYVGGRFTTYRGVAGSAYHIAKLDPTSGALDTTFSPNGAAANGFDGNVEALLVDGSTVYVGGGFRAYRGALNSAFRIAKLDALNGALDATFSPLGMNTNGFDDDVLSLAKIGSSIYAGGEFTSYRGGVDNAKYIAKLDAATGALDTTFSPPASNGFDSTVRSITALGGSLFAGGDFEQYRGSTQVRRIVKLDGTSGVVDAQFSQPGTSSGFEQAVNSVAISGGAVFVGGEFVTYRGVPASASFLAKLNASTGALDTTFTPSGATVTSTRVYSVAPFQSSILFGGQFSGCAGARCYAGAHRVNRDTRMPE